MPGIVIDGKAIAETLNAKTAECINEHLALNRRSPGLAVILVGEDPASKVYVNNKLKASAKAGILSHAFILAQNTPESQLIQIIEQLNQDETIDGILVQLPLPAHINSARIIDQIHPQKDIDGFHPYNLGLLAQRRPFLRPCTPYGVIQLLNTLGLNLQGLKATVIGVSNIVGRPMILELLIAGCTVTACHSATKDLKQEVIQADIVIAALGKPHFISGDWIKVGAIVIDVGINRGPDGKLIGDVEFESAKERAGWITPVPGGIGPMTVATLLSNTLLAYSKKFDKNFSLIEKI